VKLTHAEAAELLTYRRVEVLDPPVFRKRLPVAAAKLGALELPK